MKTTALLVALTLLAIPISAVAQVGYRSTDGHYFINGLVAGKTYYVDLEGMPLTRYAVSNKCGVLEFKPYKNELSKLDKIEINDEKAAVSYGFSYKNLPARETPKCNGQVVATRGIWLSSKGYIGISGLTPTSSQIIKFLSNAAVRNLKANECGFLSFRLDTTIPTAFIVDGKAYPTKGQTGRGIYCKRGVLYLAYPGPTPINPVPENTWRQQNQEPAPSFSTNTIVASVSGNNVSWGGITSSASGANSGSSTSGGATTSVSGSTSSSGGTSSSSSGGSASSSGTTGGGGSTSTSNGTPTSSSSTNSGSSTSSANSGGSTSSGGSSTSSGGTTGGTTSTSSGGTTSSSSGGTSGSSTTVAVTPSTGSTSGSTQQPSRPQPPTGQKMCKLETQLISIVPKSNTKYYAMTEEDQSYEEENSDSTGYILFNNINFTDTSMNGGLSDIEIGEIDLTKPSWSNRKPLLHGYSANISAVKLCQ
jgi:hypothetical protein